MKKATLFFLLLTVAKYSTQAQSCTPANSPNLGPDKTIFVSCLRDAANLTSLYNTAGLTTQWDVSNPANAAIGYHWLVATNSSGCKDTAYINVKIDVQKWLGTADSNWHNPANWSGNAVPTEKTHVLIFSGTAYPCVISNGNALAASIRILKNGTYRVRNLRQITVTTACDTLPAYYEVGPKTILIDNPTSQTIQLVDSGKVIFSGNTPQLQSLDTSSIIVSGIAPHAPYGFLRKVKAIQHTGNVYTITTGDVPMETAFKDFYFQYSQPYFNSDTALQQRTSSTNDAVAVPVDLSYSFSASASIFGNLTVRPGLTVLLDISNFHLNYAKIEGSFERAATLGLNVNAATSLSAEATLYEKMLRPFYIPSTPLVVVPTLKVKIGVEGSADVAYHASISNTSTVNAYLEYDQGGWHNGYGRTTNTEYTFSGVNGNVNLKPWVEPSIDFKLYNQDWAKGTIKARVYAIGKAHTQPKPGCKLTAGITAGIAANLQMFGINFLNVDYPELFKTEKVLYECFKPGIITRDFYSQCDSVASATITDTGSSRIIIRGFCWSTSPDPKLTDHKKEQTAATTDATAGLGTYHDTLTNLVPNAVYYLRAYAINSTDTAYGDEIHFTAPVQIGDTLEGGIVFYLDSTCHHGLVCAMTDQSSGAEFLHNFYPTQWPYFSLLDSSIGAGSKNTDSLILFNATGIGAPYLCRNYTGGNYNDWFLPSLGELRKMYDNRDLLSTLQNEYWSSNLIPGFNGYAAGSINFDNGETSLIYMSFNYPNSPPPPLCKVRAVRKF